MATRACVRNHVSGSNRANACRTRELKKHEHAREDRSARRRARRGFLVTGLTKTVRDGDVARRPDSRASSHSCSAVALGEHMGGSDGNAINERCATKPDRRAHGIAKRTDTWHTPTPWSISRESREAGCKRDSRRRRRSQTRLQLSQHRGGLINLPTVERRLQASEQRGCGSKRHNKKRRLY